MVDLYVERYLCPLGKTENVDNFNFLVGEMTYDSSDILRTLDVYSKFNDIKENLYNFIIGNGGLGKSTYLKQIKNQLDRKKIPCILIELKTLNDESSLYDVLNEYCKNHLNSSVYILLDAVDESIDCNVKNISNKIGDAITKLLTQYKIFNKYKLRNKNKIIQIKKKIKKNIKVLKIAKHFSQKSNSKTQIKTIITCRDNRVPDELVPKLKEIYNIKENNTYSLCRLTEENVESIAVSLGCETPGDFITKVKKYNLGCFASSPITLKPLIEMYKQNKLINISNNYDIYETLLSYWCQESEYRRNKALNKEDKFRLEAIEDILFVASKIALDLKIRGLSHISYLKDNSSLYVEDYYNLSFDFPSGKKISFNKELVDYTLQTKIFEKSGNKYSIVQQTYKDFLTARYLYNMHAKEKYVLNLLKVEDTFHPNFTECLAYLASKNNKIFKILLKEIPERLLLSSVYFCENSKKEALLKAYLKISKYDRISFWYYFSNRIFFNKKLYYPRISNFLKSKIRKSSNDIKDVIIEIIGDNQLNGFEQEFRKIIFNPKTELRLKVQTIYSANDCKYKMLLKDIAQDINCFTSEIDNDNTDQLRGVLLRCLYPNYINTKIMLQYLKTPKQDNYFGYYQNFILYKFSKFVNKDNAGLLLDWIKNNNTMRGVVREIYNNNYTNEIKEVFNRISKLLNTDLVNKYVTLQLQEKYSWEITSDEIVKEIIRDPDLNNFFIKQLIKRSSNVDDFRILIAQLPKNEIMTYEIPKYFKMYIKEKDIFRQEIISVLIKYLYQEFLYNNKTDDIEEIYQLIQNNKILSENFGYYINPVFLEPSTLEPLDDIAKQLKRNYYDGLKNKEKETLRKQKLKELENIDKQIKNILCDYKQNKELKNTILNIFQVLNLEKETLYPKKTLSISFDDHFRWKDISLNFQLELVQIFKDFLLSKNSIEYQNIDNYILENKYSYYWNCLMILPLLKTEDLSTYNRVLKIWANVIMYIQVNSDVALSLKQEIIQDLYNLDILLIYNAMDKIITYSSNNLPYKFLNGLENILNESLYLKLFNYVKDTSINFEIKYEIIRFLAYHHFQPVKLYIQNMINELLKNKSDKQNKVGELLGILFNGFQAGSWQYIKKLLYNNKISKEALIILIRQSNDFSHYENNSIYVLLNNEELVSLYIWLIKKYSYINEEEYKSGIVHNTDFLFEFTKHIPDYFITNGNIVEYKKIKKAFLTNRKNIQDFKKLYYRNLKKTKYNKLQNINIEYNNLFKLENLYYKQKKGFINMKIGKYNFGDNNTNYINETENKSINIGGKDIMWILILVIALVLFLFNKITVEQFLQFIH